MLIYIFWAEAMIHLNWLLSVHFSELILAIWDLHYSSGSIFEPIHPVEVADSSLCYFGLISSGHFAELMAMNEGSSSGF